MPTHYTTPSLEYGEAVRHLHSLRRWVEIREFYRALYGRYSYTRVAQLTNLTLLAWEHPARFR